MAVQLPLGFSLNEIASFDNFVAGANGAALHALQKSAAADGEAFVYLWGPPASGKTHLLQAACRAAAAAGRTAAYLPLAGPAAVPVAALENLECVDLVCLDDVEAVVGDAHWEHALFVLFNGLRESGGRLLVGAGRAVAQLAVTLPDLASRLTWGLAYRLQWLDEADRVRALRQRARARGLDLAQDAADYLMRRHARDLSALFTLLDELDRAALAAQRRLTVPFIRTFLQQRAAGSGAES